MPRPRGGAGGWRRLGVLHVRLQPVTRVGRWRWDALRATRGCGDTFGCEVGILAHSFFFFFFLSSGAAEVDSSLRLCRLSTWWCGAAKWHVAIDFSLHFRERKMEDLQLQNSAPDSITFACLETLFFSSTCEPVCSRFHKFGQIAAAEAERKTELPKRASCPGVARWPLVWESQVQCRRTSGLQPSSYCCGGRSNHIIAYTLWFNRPDAPCGDVRWEQPKPPLCVCVIILMEYVINIQRPAINNTKFCLCILFFLPSSTNTSAAYRQKGTGGFLFSFFPSVQLRTLQRFFFFSYILIKGMRLPLS